MKIIIAGGRDFDNYNMIETMKKCGKHGTVVPYENTTVFDIR